MFRLQLWLHVLDCILHWFMLRKLLTSYLKGCEVKGLTYSS